MAMFTSKANLLTISGCNCNRYGSTRSDCDQMTGQCLCKQGVTGLKCDQCQNGLPVDINGCIGKYVLLLWCNIMVYRKMMYFYWPPINSCYVYGWSCKYIYHKMNINAISSIGFLSCSFRCANGK